MSVIASYTKTPDEKKVYTIGYSKWLDASQSEVITAVVATVLPVTVPALVAVADFDAPNNLVSVAVSSGMPGQAYSVEIETTTSIPQIKEDCMLFTVLEACA